MGYSRGEKYNNAVGEFVAILETYIFPLIEIDGEPKIVHSHSVPAYSNIRYFNVSGKRIIRIYPGKGETVFHAEIEIKGRKPNGFITPVTEELMSITGFVYKNGNFVYRGTDAPFNKTGIHLMDTVPYREWVCSLAYERGICKWIESKWKRRSLNESIFSLLAEMNKWSQKTYEDSNTAFSILFSRTNKNEDGVNFIEFMKNEQSAVFTDGMSSAIILDTDGRILKHVSIFDGVQDDDNKPPFAPLRFKEFANACNDNIGIILQTNGNILVFESKNLIFVKHSGKWFHIDNHRIRNIIENYYECENNKDLAKETYLSVLDVSFSRAGGCISVINDSNIEEAKRLYENDSLDNCNNNDKRDILKVYNTLIESEAGEGRNFLKLSRRLKQELLSLDGAMVMDSTGKILSVGAIVEVPGGSSGGGRLAAAKALAKYGMAIKISTDGHVQAFASNKDSSADPTEIFALLRDEKINTFKCCIFR